jgi:hypothetical protein
MVFMVFIPFLGAQKIVAVATEVALAVTVDCPVEK